MKNKSKSLMVTTTVVCLFPMILSLLLYKQLPSQIPIHFDNSGVANSYLPKAIACYGLPIGFAVINLILHFFQYADPKRANSSETMKYLASGRFQ